MHKSSIYIDYIGRQRLVGGRKMSPLRISVNNKDFSFQTIYFAWDTEYDLSELVNRCKNKELLFNGTFYERSINNYFPAFFFQILEEEGLFPPIYRNKRNEYIKFEVVIKEGDNYADALLRFGYNNFGHEVYNDIFTNCCNLGSFSIINKDYSSALEDFIRSLEINPKDPYALYCAAEVLYKLNRSAEALTYIDETIKIQPDKSAYLLSAKIKNKLSDFKGANDDKHIAHKL